MDDASEASLAAPSMLCLITMTSAYWLTIFIVSHNVSPFETLVNSFVSKPRTLPPNLSMALEKLNLVLVDGSKNNDAMTLPFMSSGDGFFSSSLAKEIICNISLLEKSLIDITSLPLKAILKRLERHALL